MKRYPLLRKFQLWLGVCLLGLTPSLTTQAALLDISQVPLFLGGGSTPLIMLVMGRDHKLYYEAYNDASDLNGDGVLDTKYKPNEIDYFGLFDSNLCYNYGSEKFTPISKASSKKCSGAWSGDFLNYLTTSRMDALRKVLYGGYRSTDTASSTVLERSYIPQDAHSWGKEYFSVEYDGYDIADYTPMKKPKTGTRHLFANTTPLDTTKPLLRVINDSQYRIWEWVSIERPVAGDKCLNGGSGPSCTTTGGTNHPGHPANASDFQTKMIGPYANEGNLTGSKIVTKIDENANKADNYLTVFKGTLKIINAGTYEFAVDGDDAVQVLIDGQVVSGYYGGHGACNCTTYNGSVDLEPGNYDLEFHHEEDSGDDSYYLWWKGPDSLNNWQIVPTTAFANLVQNTYSFNTAASSRTDYVVRVDACIAGLRIENNPDSSEYCRGYPASNPTVYKPAGLLQQYGEDEPERMAFGLLSGSYAKNTSGGVLRKNIGPFSKTGDTGNEINRDTGQFSSFAGIVKTLDNFKIIGFGGSHEYGTVDGKACGWITTRPIAEGECRMWGNPIGEMLYETLRYFAGEPSKTAPAPSTAYNYPTDTDATVVLPKPTWKYPFRNEAGGYSGAKCFMMTISDINPSFDTDQIPGSAFTNSIDSTLPGLNVASEAATIWANEEQSNPAFIGESLDNTPTYDGAPTPKTVTSLGRIRGLSPEEPTKKGGYYSASVAYFGNAKGIGGKPGKQRVETMSVAVASPLPRIEIPITKTVGNATVKSMVTLVPFAKSVGGSEISAKQGDFQPTDQIVDFYVEKIANTGPGNQDATDNEGRPHGVFRINYEDVEQGADHDMDAIVRYEFWLQADNTIKVTLDSIYAAGTIIQHMGYVISGTDGQDGIYLDVRDLDTSSGDPDYYLDTPVSTTTDASGMTKKRSDWSSTAFKDSVMLPTTATRLFQPAQSGIASTAAFIKHDPLWYAAKWGGFADKDSNSLPDTTAEWDSDGNGVPDNYYLVTNAGTLKKQLSQAFSAIQSKSGSAAVVAVDAGKAFGDGDVYQARFNSEDWSGQVLALTPANLATGTLQATEKWDAGKEINKQTPIERQILSYKPSTDKGIVFDWAQLDTAQQDALSPLKTDNITRDYVEGKKRLAFLRGDNSNEGEETGQYRKRSSDLGDIVNSSPVYVGRPILRYRDDLDSPAYSTFRNAQNQRTPIVYAGSNDGMLHAFNAADGKEKFAYVPSVVYRNLSILTDQGYNTKTGDTQTQTDQTYASKHRYYVDGSVIVSDVIFGGAWHSLLVGRLGAGGQGVFALDITDPNAIAASSVLWEFTDADDADLGYTFGKSFMQKVNGQWSVVFSNGYNSADPDSDRPSADRRVGSGKGFLYVLNAETGAMTQKMEAADSTKSTVISSGLSSPYPYDVYVEGSVSNDKPVDWIYAGDVAGNLWKFYVSDIGSGSQWTAKLLFTAYVRDLSGNLVKDSSTPPKPIPQPITTAPIVVGHPHGGTLVLFGTGRYLGQTDQSNTDTQSYYAIWDQESLGWDNKVGGDNENKDIPFSTVDPENGSSLLQQKFDSDVTVGTETYRTTTAMEICWNSTPWESGTGKDCEFICGKANGCDTETGRVALGTKYTVTPKRGWYINLPFLNYKGGERVYDDSQLSAGRIIFVSKAFPQAGSNTVIEPCETKPGGGKSWLNMLDALSGKRLAESFYNVDAQGKTEPVLVKNASGDLVATSSKAIEGVATGPAISKGKDNVDYILVGNANTGGINTFAMKAASSRQSWRQLDSK